MAPWLSIAIWLPIAFGVILLTLGSADHAPFARRFALFAALLSLLSMVPLFLFFDAAQPGMQLREDADWINILGARYALGIDGIAFWFLPLTAFMTFIAILSAWESVSKQVHQYLGAFLILSGLMIGVFCAQDGVLFYVFFEATLLPMVLIIGVWGGPRRIYAAFKFFLYTLLGSLLMLAALVYLYVQSHSFSIAAWQALPLAGNVQTLLFFAFFAAFAVKVPMWPLHTWLPDAHVEAPTAGSIILAAIMLKLGAYGFLRFSLPILPDASREWAWLMLALSLAAVITIGLIALVQSDMKKLVAYSSVAHMGFVTAGFFLFNELGVTGALVQMISHGFVSGAMFLCIGVLYDRLHSREIADYGAVVRPMPRFAAFATFFALANCGLPGTSGFVGEWMVILGAVGVNFWLALLLATTLVFGAAYTLWMVKRVYFGARLADSVAALKDVNARELLLLALLAAFTLWLGVYPKPLTDILTPAASEIVRLSLLSKLPA